MSLFTCHDDTIHHRIEGRTIPTLDPQKVPRPSIVGLFTIIARNVDHPGQFGRDLLQGDPRSHGIPGGHHAFLRLGRLFTYRTPRVMGGQLPKALPVNGMTAGHFM